MQYSEIKPQLSAEAFNAFVDIADWLDDGGLANDTIPFCYDWSNCQTCVGGALDYLVGELDSTSIARTGVNCGMNNCDVSQLFLSADAGAQTPENMAKVIREWLVTGEIHWIDQFGQPEEIMNLFDE